MKQFYRDIAEVALRKRGLVDGNRWVNRQITKVPCSSFLDRRVAIDILVDIIERFEHSYKLGRLIE